MQPCKLVFVALLLALLTACQPKPKAENFVGTWKSSRLTTPLVLHANGEWEIRGEAGRALQYGVWQVRDRGVVWTTKVGNNLQRDPNAIVSVSAQRFELRETDGSVTRFDRIK